MIIPANDDTLQWETHATYVGFMPGIARRSEGGLGLGIMSAGCLSKKVGEVRVFQALDNATCHFWSLLISLFQSLLTVQSTSQNHLLHCSISQMSSM